MPKKSMKVDMEAGTCRIWNGEAFHGTTVCYAATPDDDTAFQCDYVFGILFESRPTEVRALREERRRAGKTVRKLPSDRLHNELMVAFGPDMSAKDAVTTLRRLAGVIQKTAYSSENERTKNTLLSG